jgi:hypothetical protein
MAGPASIEEYLEQVGRGVGNPFGRRYRQQFRDHSGTAELGMLAAPTAQEYDEMQRAVAAMTAREKEQADALTDEQVRDIAARAKVDCGTVSIFCNGYALARRAGPARRTTQDKET